MMKEYLAILVVFNYYNRIVILSVGIVFIDVLKALQTNCTCTLIDWLKFSRMHAWSWWLWQEG